MLRNLYGNIPHHRFKNERQVFMEVVQDDDEPKSFLRLSYQLLVRNGSM